MKPISREHHKNLFRGPITTRRNYLILMATWRKMNLWNYFKKLKIYFYFMEFLKRQRWLMFFKDWKVKLSFGVINVNLIELEWVSFLFVLGQETKKYLCRNMFLPILCNWCMNNNQAITKIHIFYLPLNLKKFHWAITKIFPFSPLLQPTSILFSLLIPQISTILHKPPNFPCWTQPFN